MARKQKLPTVGAKQLHLTQLSPRVRRVLHHRATAASRRQYAPLIHEAKRGFGEANREYKTQATSARAATGIAENVLTQALRGLGKGNGQLRQSLVKEVKTIPESVPALLAGAGEERSKAINETRAKIAQDRAEMLSHGASAFNELLKEERGTGQTSLKDEVNAAQAKKAAKREHSTAELRSLANAGLSLHQAISHWKKDEAFRNAHPLKTNEEWLVLAQEVAKHTTGVDLSQAMQAVEALRQHWKKNPSAAVHGIQFHVGTE
jgi:hypothetical protein